MAPTRYFEAHGTGPIPQRFLYLVVSDSVQRGSAKSNIGHLEGASGLAGVIKALLVLENGIIPPQANFEKLNPRIDGAGLNIQIPTLATLWPVRGLRRASVNSFGASGTNAHAVLDDVYHTLSRLGLRGNHNTVADPAQLDSRGLPSLLAAPDSSSNNSRILMLSSSDKSTLPRMTTLYTQWVEEKMAKGEMTPCLVDHLVYTLSERRSSLPWKSFALLKRHEDITNLDSVISLPVRSLDNPKIGFVFTGQGAQWCGMGKELLYFPLFAESIEQSQRYLKTLGYLGRLKGCMNHAKEPCSINRPEQSQVLCTMIQIALVDLFEGLKLQPVGVIGHSSGEIAAAYCAGAISKTSALKLAFHRGVLSEYIRVQDNSRGMMAVRMAVEKTQSLIDQLGLTTTLFVACINSRASVTVSGPRSELQRLGKGLEPEGIFHRLLHVDVAYHSPQMQAVADLYAERVKRLDPGMQQKKRVVMISSVSGKFVEHEDLCQIDYWVRNMLQPLIESWTVCIATLRRKISAVTSALEVLGSLKCYGFDINIDKANRLEEKPEHPSISRRVLHDLPEYPFNHSDRYWPRGRLGTEFRFRRHRKLDLLGKPAIDWNPLEPRWTNFLKLHELPWAVDHQIHGTVIYPAAGMIVMAVEAAKQLANLKRKLRGFKLANIHCKNALMVPTTAEGLETHLHFHPMSADEKGHAPSWEFHLYSVQGEQWHEHCHGQIQLEYTEESNDISDDRQQQQSLHELGQAHCSAQNEATWHSTPEQFYSSVWKSGYTFGPALRVMENIRYTDKTKEVTADVKCFEWETINNTNHYQAHVVHPTTLDGLFQPAVAVYCRAGQDVMSTAVPVEIQSMWISNSGLSHPHSSWVKSRSRLIQSSITGYETTVSALDTDSEKVLVDVRGLRLQFISGDSAVTRDPAVQHMGYLLHYREDIAMLNAEDLQRLTKAAQKDKNTVSSVRDLLRTLLNRASFKSPTIKILHIINGDDELVGPLLDDLFPIQPSDSDSLSCNEYVIAIASDDERCHDVSMRSGLTIVDWNDISKKLEHGSKATQYDFVIAPYSSHSDMLVHLYSLLTNGGRVLLFNPNRCIRQRESYQEESANLFQVNLNDTMATTQSQEITLTKVGFTRILSLVYTEHALSPLVIASKPFPGSCSEPLDLVLVMDHTSKYQQALAECLRSQWPMGVQKHSVEDMTRSDAPSLNLAANHIFLYEIEHPLLASLSQATFYALRNALLPTTRVLWLTCRDRDGVIHPDFAMIDGFARVIRSEHPNATVVTARLEYDKPESQASTIVRLIQSTNFQGTGQDYEPEYSVMDGMICVPRIYPAKRLSQKLFDDSERPVSHTVERAFGTGPPLKLGIGTPGLLDSLHFTEDFGAEKELAADEVEIRVGAAGLNFKDLLIALGRVEGTSIGIECAGTITRCGKHVIDLVPGDRVTCLCNAAFSSHVRARGASVARLPSSLSVELAASIPVQFGTAYYAIQTMAKLRPGESILIHSGAGGTGQASIQIAQHLGGEVFATVSSRSKKQLLIERYGIPETHIFYSRDTSFAQGILQVTKNRGVDVVLNSLAGESLLASWDIIAPYGRFIELGKKDINQNSSLPMRPFSRGASFVHMETTAMSADNPELVRNVLDELLSLFAEHKLQPVHQLQVLPISDLQKGLQILQTGNSVGKFVVSMKDDALVQIRENGIHQAQLNPEKTYLIAGGTSGLGLATASWMVKEKGARHLLLLSRSGLKSDAAVRVVEDLRRSGARIEAPQCDICDEDKLHSLLKDYGHVLPPISGCIQACMVLKDALLSNLSFEEWIERIVGSAGQANYAAGNTYMDELSRYRIAKGEKAVTLDLGVMLDHGALARNEALRTRILAAGYLTSITQAEYFRLLEHYCNPNRVASSTDDGEFAIGFASPSQLRETIATNGSTSISLPLYQHIYHGGNHSTSQINGNTEHRDQPHHQRSFLQAKSTSEAEAIVSDALFQRLSKSLPGISSTVASQADFMNKPLHVHEVYSLMAIEVRSWLAKEFAADVPIFEILGDATVASLCRSAAMKSTLRAPNNEK
ncbi:hypothetical protein K491DRAFT_679868 [Lophiostoma macrostomum CBS 122681]|uniref:Carrier domain-containing protein n=1 Tax=Lophiostoma macrostomum CBS 122681 TaxID=1314788 RepID=A0A6A6T261_9PLEO|nr:hypothetical protein K491DRAFT_679868 [Lophiostoma macrostomum CBS 122681]